MSRSFKRRFAYLAVGTAAVVGMSGAFGTAAFAAGDDVTLPTSGAAFDALAQQVVGDGKVEAAAADAEGNFVVYSTTALPQIQDDATRALLESANNVKVTIISTPFDAYDANEVVGGAGYADFVGEGATSVGLCSVGFSGFTPDGDPAIISAGHCTADGENKYADLTLPTGDPAGGGDPENGDIQLISELGILGFSQYGGPGNSDGTAGDTKSVDISTFDITNEDLSLLPRVTDWTTAASEDLAASTLPVRSVGDAQVGVDVAKSGRTTGFTEGVVQSVKGWASVGGRQVYGFMSELESKEGDSGGSIIQGDKAVGVVSGGTTTPEGQSLVWGADLKAGLALTGGYTVEVQLDAPALVSPTDGGDVEAGTTISGTAATGSTLQVQPSKGDDFEVAITDGAWSFPAPVETGEISYAVRAVEGFSTSPVTAFKVNVVPAPLAAPVITSPAEGQVVETQVTKVTGTGTPGATVELTGAVADTATVAADGTWTVETELGYGYYTLNARQTSDDAPASSTVSVSFTVVPVAPAITDPKNGTGYDQGSGPKAVSGTGIDGAVVTVSVNGSQAGKATVKNGKWSVPLAAELAAGKATFTAVQAVDGVAGTSTTSVITITAVNNGGGGNGNGGNGNGNGGGSAPAGNGSNGSLANTGATVTPLLGGGLALLIAAGGVLLVSRRLNTARRNS